MSNSAVHGIEEMFINSESLDGATESQVTNICVICKMLEANNAQIVRIK